LDNRQRNPEEVAYAHASGRDDRLVSRAQLMTAVGKPSLLPVCRDAAEYTAITLPAVAVQTDSEHRMAFTATSLLSFPPRFLHS
jgi:hypothetical protein